MTPKVNKVHTENNNSIFENQINLGDKFTNYNSTRGTLVDENKSLASSIDTTILQNTNNSTRDIDLCALLPKIELHAHLHGSIRLATLHELALKKQNVQNEENLNDASNTMVEESNQNYFQYRPEVLLAENKSLSDCFYIFDVIHHVVTSLDVVGRITKEVLEDFAAQNVKYLELRTTPRDLADADSEDYIRQILTVFHEFEKTPSEHTNQKEYNNAKSAYKDIPHNNQTNQKMIPRLLISIDRSKSPSHAEKSLHLAGKLAAESQKLYNGTNYIVGIDFSGNPYKRNFEEFRSIFIQARNHYGFKISVHTAEIDNNISDTKAILNFKPDRLGHALWLDDECTGKIGREKIPVEICPTSNLRTLELSVHSQHPTLQRWLQMNHPISICTDDSGVFNTNITNEYRILAREFDLTSAQILSIARNTIEQIFECEEVKESLQKEFLLFLAQDLSNILTYTANMSAFTSSDDNKPKSI